MKSLRPTRKLLPLYVMAAALAGLSTVISTTAMAAPSSAAAAAAATSLPACPFWAGDITPPPRPATTFTAPLQTAPAVDYSSRMAAPTLTGTLVNGQVDLTISRVPGAVAYRVWRDGVDVGWITDWGQATLTATDTAPCQDAYYQVVALSSNSTADSAMGQLSPPYWLGSDGTIALGPQNPAARATIPMRVTSYNDGGQTADGYTTQIGVCATDPRVIPWGTYFYVPYYGDCVAEDIGTWISDDAVDVWLPGTQADNWGVQYFTITILANPYSSSSSGPPSPSPTPSSSPTPTGTGGTCAAAWSAGATYTAGAEVSYSGADWTANQWSYDEPPGGSSGAWTSDGPCTG